MNWSTADLWDAFEDDCRVAEPLFSDFGGVRKFCGTVRTVKCHEDNSLVRQALEESGQGQVLVVDGGGSLRCALLGDRLAQLGIDNGWQGIVVYGCVRDSAVLAEMPFGVKALATNPRKSIKRNEGQRGLRLSFGGVDLVDGDHLYADGDGILLSQRSLI